MKIGTKSVLFGAHQFLIHPWFVAFAWWRLYGFPLDPRLWVAFFVHDLGYWGKPDMDGPEGEAHPILGARIMHALFDWDFSVSLHRWNRMAWRKAVLMIGAENRDLFSFHNGHAWHDFALFHSRFMARRFRRQHSRLCVADKLATALTPAWLYLPLVRLTGEIDEYMHRCGVKEASKYFGELNNERENELLKTGDERAWFEAMTSYLRRWVEEHRDGRPDGWTPEAQVNAE